MQYDSNTKKNIKISASLLIFEIYFLTSHASEDRAASSDKPSLLKMSVDSSNCLLVFPCVLFSHDSSTATSEIPNVLRRSAEGMLSCSAFLELSFFSHASPLRGLPVTAPAYTPKTRYTLRYIKGCLYSMR